MFIDVVKNKKTTLVGASTGLVVGLVAITPGAGFVPIWASFIIGALVSPICYFGVGFIKRTLKIDDALDAFGCHGIGGIWGGIATGIFTKSSINPVAKWDGLIYGDYHLFAAQIIGIIPVSYTHLYCIGIAFTDSVKSFQKSLGMFCLPGLLIFIKNNDPVGIILS